MECIGSHSKNHKKLTLLNEKDAIDEIINSKDELETLTGETVNSFAIHMDYIMKILSTLLKKISLSIHNK